VLSAAARNAVSAAALFEDPRHKLQCRLARAHLPLALEAAGK
jgi:hypothetical protein